MLEILLCYFTMLVLEFTDQYLLFNLDFYSQIKDTFISI
jgi:hypothetical protein